LSPRSPDDGLRPLILKHLPVLAGSVPHWVPIESALTGTGIADLYGRWRGHAVWCECKATSAWALRTLTEFQVGFALTEIRAGGRCVVATRRRSAGGPRSPAVDELWLHDGAGAAALMAGGLKNYPPVHVSAGGPKNWDWEGFGVALFG
jgi:hypothetical protein